MSSAPYPTPLALLSRQKPRQKPVSTVAKAKAKKIVPAIDTNPNSYDRTDPFYAFNALIKLLGSLPSRIGGCQYKLTPDEHKLSLHLLAIVEPFVGLAPSRRTITRQPTEVLDSIMFHIDSRHDLLALAFSCHRMYDIVCPRHLEYRVMRCKVSSIRVWNHLIINRSLARNVRRLEIMDERSTEPEIVPSSILPSDTDLESTDDELGLHDKQERYLVSALAKMIALASFSWSCNHSPISIDNVWPALLRNEERKRRKQTVASTPPPLSTFLFAHPNLEVLHLDICSILTTGLSSAPGLVLPPNSLPRLRELHSNKEVATAILSCPCDQPRPLETLKGFRLSGIHGGRDPDLVFLASLKRRGTHVRRIELSGYTEMDDLRRLVECAPGLTWLDVGRKGGAHATARERENIRTSTGVMTATNTLEWATLLSDLPDLMTFHGVRLFFEASGTASLPGVTATSTQISLADRSRIRKNDEVAGLLAWKCPKLRRVDHWEEGSGKVVVLVKDHEKEKVRWEVRRVKV
ncbi:hypothetical protein C0995_009943 [Termitomyces sp. Mi166|nr:hypothetical protein C0995_009943 [Termitomyces sp. Mi166\